MAILRRIGWLPICLAAWLVPGPVLAACQFDEFFEISNPFDPSCGGKMWTYTGALNNANSLALGYPPPIPVVSLTAVAGFREYASLHAQHQLLMMDNADQVIGTIVGQTVSGRDIWAYSIGDTSDSLTWDGLSEAAVQVTGGTHAREWQTPEAVTELLETLVERKHDGGIGQYLAENLNVVLIPVLNVDGFITTQTYPTMVTADPGQPREGRMRRKNLRDPNTQGAIDVDINSIDNNFWGVDLNRNSGIGFGMNGGSWGPGRETSLIYRGGSPATEPEIQALQFAAANLAPESRLRLYSDTHAFTQILFTPLTGNTRRDNITVELMNRVRLSSPRGYRDGKDSIQNTGNMGIGTTADYFAYTYQIPSWTLETEPLNGGQDYAGTGISHSGFVLPDDEVERMRDELAQMYLLGFYRQADPPRVQAAQITETQTGTVVYEAEWLPDTATARRLVVSTNQAMVPGTEYRLWLAFNKPMRWRNAAGQIARHQGQAVDAATGTVRLEFPTLSGQNLDLDTSNPALWLTQPGGAPFGYLRYADDALATTFTLPVSLTVSEDTTAVLSIANRDYAQGVLDADPSTAVDWGNGHWLRYEDEFSVTGDSGGVDCNLRPFVGPAAGGSDPGASGLCVAAQFQPPAPVPPPTPTSSGGGGGSLSWPVLCLLVLCLARRRRFLSV